MITVQELQKGLEEAMLPFAGDLNNEETRQKMLKAVSQYVMKLHAEGKIPGALTEPLISVTRDNIYKVLVANKN